LFFCLWWCEKIILTQYQTIFIVKLFNFN
jgi:hypothetical protein